MSLSSVKSETALRSRLFSSSSSFRRFTCSVFSPPNSWRHREYVTSLTPIWRIASTMFWPCETRTSTCRSFATISSGLYRFLAIAVLLDVKDIPQVGPLQWGWITSTTSLTIRSPMQPSSARSAWNGSSHLAPRRAPMHSYLKVSAAAVDDESSQNNEKRNCGGDRPPVIFAPPWVGPPAVVTSRRTTSVFRVHHIRARMSSRMPNVLRLLKTSRPLCGVLRLDLELDAVTLSCKSDLIAVRCFSKKCKSSSKKCTVKHSSALLRF